MALTRYAERVRTRLDAARFFVRRGRYECARDSAYHATLETARGALQGLALDFPGTHYGVVKLFHRQIVKIGLEDVELRAILTEIEDVMLKADSLYIPEPVHGMVDREDALKAIKRAEALFETVASKLKWLKYDNVIPDDQDFAIIRNRKLPTQW